MSFHNKWREFKKQGPLLLEIDETEVDHIADFLSGMKSDDLPFKHLFGDRMRLRLPFRRSPKDAKLSEWEGSLRNTSWVVDWKSGTISRDVKSARNQQTRTEKMKIGKWLMKYIRLRGKYQFSRRDQEFGIANDILAIIEPEGEFGDRGAPSADAEEAKKKLASFVSFDWARDHTEEYAKKILSVYQKTRGEMLNMSIVVTRHPIDVLRMADFEHIQSCHSPPSRGGGGFSSYYQCAVAEAHGHGAVAYIVNDDQLQELVGPDEDVSALDDQELFSDDARDVEGIVPLARVRVRRIVFKTSQDGPQVDLAVPEERIYGPDLDGFHSTVVKWLHTAQEGREKLFPRNSEGQINLGQFSIVGGTQQDTSANDMFQTLYPEAGHSHRAGSKYYGAIGTNYKLEDEILAGLGIGTAAFEAELKDIAIVWDEQNYNVLPSNYEDLDLNDILRKIIPTIEVEVGVNAEDGTTWASLAASQKFSIPVSEFKGRATAGRLYYDLDHIKDEFNDMGVDWIDSITVGPQRRHDGEDMNNIYINFKMGSERVSYYPYIHDPTELERVLDNLAKFHSDREGWKSELEMMLKRYDLLEGAELYQLAQEVDNATFDENGWDTEVDDPYNPTELTADIWGIEVRKDAAGPQTDRILSSRDFKIALKKAIVLSATQKASVGDIQYPPYSFSATHIKEKTYQYRLHFGVTDDSSDAQVAVLTAVLKHLDADDIQLIVDRTLSDIVNTDSDTAQKRLKAMTQDSAKEPASETSKLFEGWRRYVKK